MHAEKTCYKVYLTRATVALEMLTHFMCVFIFHPVTVKESIYVILGLLAEIYPEHMTQYASKLVDIYLRALKAEVIPHY